MISMILMVLMQRAGMDKVILDPFEFEGGSQIAKKYLKKSSLVAKRRKKGKGKGRLVSNFFNARKRKLK